MPNCNYCQHRFDHMDRSNLICQTCIEAELDGQIEMAHEFEIKARDTIKTQRALNAINRRINWLKQNWQNSLFWDNILKYLERNEQALKYIKEWDKGPNIDALISNAAERSEETRISGNGTTKGDHGLDRS